MNLKFNIFLLQQMHEDGCDTVVFEGFNK